MKILLIGVLSLFSSLSFAEVKPYGAVVPSACGVNTLESVGGPQYPSQVCVYTVEGYENVTLVGIEVNKKVNYFKVMTPKQPTWYSVPAIVEGVGSYNIFKGEGSEIAISFDHNENMLSGPLFSVVLEGVAVTQ